MRTCAEMDTANSGHACMTMIVWEWGIKGEEFLEGAGGNSGDGDMKLRVSKTLDINTVARVE